MQSVGPRRRIQLLGRSHCDKTVTHCDRTSCYPNAWEVKCFLHVYLQVDVGVFWTDNAQKAVGGAAQMQAKIRAAVVATNAVYAASKLTLRLRLVFMGEPNSCPCYLPSADRMLPACTDEAHLSSGTC